MPLPSSAEFRKLVYNQHRIRSRAVVLRNGQILPDVSLAITDGNATENRNNDVRGTCGVTLVDPKGILVPRGPSDPLYPGYTEIQIFRGVYLSNGTVEEKSLGVFGFDHVQANNSGQKLAIDIMGYDRSQRISDAKFLDETVVSGNVATIIRNIIAPRLPFGTFSFTSTNYTVNSTTFARGDDPWKACKTLAASAGLELYFDRWGVCCLQPFSVSTEPDWVFTEGSQAVVLELDKTLTRAQNNHWIEIAEGSDIPVPFMAEAKDQANIDATGDRPYFHVSSLYTAVDQCQAAADAQKAANAGSTEVIQLTLVPNPAIIVGDIIALTNDKSGVGGLYNIDKVITPMAAITGQNLTTRAKVV